MGTHLGTPLCIILPGYLYYINLYIETQVFISLNSTLFLNQFQVTGKGIVLTKLNKFQPKIFLDFRVIFGYNIFG